MTRPTLLLIPCALFAAVWAAGSGCGPAKKSCENTCPSAGATTCEGTELETCEKAANGCLAWSLPVACPAEQTCQGHACACTIGCGSTCCSAGEACIDGACCPDPCGTSCGCTAPAICAVDGTGTPTCATPCSTSAECNAIGPSAPCCGVQPDGGGACIPNPAANVLICECGTDVDCSAYASTPACAPDTTAGEAGAYVCAPLNGSHNGGCGSVGGSIPVECMTPGDDCWGDSSGNSFCTKSCSTNSDCPTGSVCNTNATCNDLGKQCTGMGVVPLAGGCMPSSP